MRTTLLLTALLLVPVAALLAADNAAQETNINNPATPNTGTKPFVVYRHFRPDGDPANFITYEDVQVLQKELGIRPLVLGYATQDEESCKAQVKKYVRKYDNCPIVFDIEKNINPRHMAEIIKWAHEAAPGCTVGHYAMPHKGLVPCAGISGLVDAFYPSLYVNYKTTWPAWASEVSKRVAQAHRQGKPVYLFLWPMYHGGKGYVPAGFWKFQLETARKCGADGVVIWGAGKAEHWEQAPWWKETVKFMETLKENPSPAK
jgi:hypothetical protein